MEGRKREREAQKETREEEEEKREREKEEKEEEKINAGKEGMRIGIRIVDALVGKESNTGEGVSAGQPVRERRRRGVEGGAVGTPEKKRKNNIKNVGIMISLMTKFNVGLI